jgi:SAM-dependent methyltransferase
MYRLINRSAHDTGLPDCSVPQAATLFDLDIHTTQKENHPARYSAQLLPVFVQMLSGCRSLLDPFAGTGQALFSLQPILKCEIVAIELDPTAWNNVHPQVEQGDAADLPFADNSFDAVLTSPVYGNRMSDHHNAKDASRRNTYWHQANGPLSENNAGTMHFHQTAYKTLHVAAWAEVHRVLEPGGRFILNIKDFIRKGERQRVTAWHDEACQAIGFKMLEHRQVECRGNGNGANGQLRVPYESVILFRKGTRL